MTALVTSVVVEQPLRSDVRARPSFKRHARPFPAPAPQSAAALLLFTDSHSSLKRRSRKLALDHSLQLGIHIAFRAQPWQAHKKGSGAAAERDLATMRCLPDDRVSLL